jgi:hypothetical protein
VFALARAKPLLPGPGYRKKWRNRRQYLEYQTEVAMNLQTLYAAQSWARRECPVFRLLATIMGNLLTA